MNIGTDKRFWSKVDIRTTDECWPWNASSTPLGYGKFGRGGRYGGWEFAHRMAYRLCSGEIPDDASVLHRCDNPPCCNPNHLWLGSQADNIHDMDKKGRRVNPPRFGENNGGAKLTAAQVKEIRREYSNGGVKQCELATKYGISYQQVHNIVNNHSWRDR
jgi:hypothetical protein